MIETLANSPALYLSATLVLGLIVGSFLNVVIHRLPLMLEYGWRRDAAEILGRPGPEGKPPSLLWPGSSCPHCGESIKPWHNLPVLSYLWLRGRCAACAARISPQYPIVELVTGLLSVAVVWRFGFEPAALWALAFTWIIVALAAIDWRTQCLPDNLTLPLLWLGLLASLGLDGGTGGASVDPASAILGAAAGYLSLWLVYHAFRLATGKEGMGYGDFKLLAAIGAWMGWQALPLVIVLSSVAGAAVGIAMTVSGRLERGHPMPFGPFLAVAGWLVLMR